jgi:hypothetical protein
MSSNKNIKLENNIKNNNNEDDDDMPELEDFTEELSKIRIKTNTNFEDDSEIKVNIINNDNNKTNINIPITITENIKNNNSIVNFNTNNQSINQKEKSKEKEVEKSKDEGFRPKRGFFHRIAESENKANNLNTNNNNNNININNKSNLEKEKEKEKITDLTNIKATGETVKEKIFSNFKSEVNMNANDLNKSMNYLNNKKDEWCNNDLLTAMMKKPSLMKLFSNPRFPEAITLMQKDPKKFMEIYGKNPDFNEFIKEFSGTMANHFENLGKEKEKENSIPVDKESEILLAEPKVKAMIERIQREGKLDFGEIQRDPDLAKKIKILIDKGIFKLQNY